MDLLMADGGIEIVDFREGDYTLDQLWEKLCGNLYGDANVPIPHRLHLTSNRFYFLLEVMLFLSYFKVHF